MNCALHRGAEEVAAGDEVDAAVEGEDCAGDEGSGGGAEEEGCALDVAGLTDAAQRDVAADGFGLFFFS